MSTGHPSDVLWETVREAPAGSRVVGKTDGFGEQYLDFNNEMELMAVDGVMGLDSLGIQLAQASEEYIRLGVETEADIQQLANWLRDAASLTSSEQPLPQLHWHDTRQQYCYRLAVTDVFGSSPELQQIGLSMSISFLDKERREQAAPCETALTVRSHSSDRGLRRSTLRDVATTLETILPSLRPTMVTTWQQELQRIAADIMGSPGDMLLAREVASLEQQLFKQRR